MILKCSACGGECVTHTPDPAATCFLCFAAGTLRPADPAAAGDVARSWEGLLGKSDEELMDFCRELAEDAFGEGD